MAKKDRFNFTKDKILPGMKSYGWKCSKLYSNHNLWIKESRSSGYIVKECFPKNAVPNKNANYNVLED